MPCPVVRHPLASCPARAAAAAAAALVAREATGVGTRIDAAAAVATGEGEVAAEAIALPGDGGPGAAAVNDPNPRVTTRTAREVTRWQHSRLPPCRPAHLIQWRHSRLPLSRPSLHPVPHMARPHNQTRPHRSTSSKPSNALGQNKWPRPAANLRPAQPHLRVHWSLPQLVGQPPRKAACGLGCAGR